MKGLKCIKYLALFITLLGGFVILSEDTNALKYSIGSLPLTYPKYHFYKIHASDGNDYYTFDEDFGGYPDFYIDYSETEGISFPKTYQFTGNYDLSTNSCSIPPTSNSKYYYDGVGFYTYNDKSTISMQDPYTLDHFYRSDHYFDEWNLNESDKNPFDQSRPLASQFSVSNSRVFCNIYNHQFGTAGFYPSFNQSSLTYIPLVNGRGNYEQSYPFWYAFNTIPLIRTDYVDGVVLTSDGLPFSRLYGKAPSSFHRWTSSLELFDNYQTDIFESEDNPVHETVYSFEITGTLEFEKPYTLGSNADVIMSVVNSYNPNIDFSDESQYFRSVLTINNQKVYALPDYISEIVCSYTDYHEGIDDKNQIDFSCSYNSSINGGYVSEINFHYLRIGFGFVGDRNSGSSSAYFLSSTTGDYTLKSMYIITNGDSTSANWDASAGGLGGNMESAPGNEGLDESYNPDWLTTLKNLFHFNFLNPFAPIFNLFTNSESCVQIPTLSGMLHSEETQVCPWFSSSTRAIVTPVLGLSAMMLVFGFAVRWLGSSSGNLFEDSEPHQAGNVSLQNKYYKRKGKK